MKATGEVMSICHNFGGALMKAIRSLEQHVDSLMSYDFTDLDESELIEELAVVDDRRIWKIAEAIRRDISKNTSGNFKDRPLVYRRCNLCRDGTGIDSTAYRELLLKQNTVNFRIT